MYGQNHVIMVVACLGVAEQIPNWPQRAGFLDPGASAAPERQKPPARPTACPPAAQHPAHRQPPSIVTMETLICQQ